MSRVLWSSASGNVGHHSSVTILSKEVLSPDLTGIVICAKCANNMDMMMKEAVVDFTVS